MGTKTNITCFLNTGKKRKAAKMLTNQAPASFQSKSNLIGSSNPANRVASPEQSPVYETIPESLFTPPGGAMVVGPQLPVMYSTPVAGSDEEYMTPNETSHVTVIKIHPDEDDNAVPESLPPDTVESDQNEAEYTQLDSASRDTSVTNNYTEDQK